MTVVCVYFSLMFSWLTAFQPSWNGHVVDASGDVNVQEALSRQKEWLLNVRRDIELTNTRPNSDNRMESPTLDHRVSEITVQTELGQLPTLASV